MMDLDSAIQHCKEKVQEQAKKGCYSCAEEHQQLAVWLKELKTLKVSRKELLNDIDMAIKASNMDDAYSVGLRNGMRVIKAFIDDEEPEYEKCCHEESRSEIPNTCEDAISRQAVLNAMYELCNTGETLKENPWRDNPHIDAVVEAIEELPSVTPQQRTGRWIDAEVLDKIRAEIDQYLFQNEFGSAYRKEVSQIIDKYKAESEEKGNE